MHIYLLDRYITIILVDHLVFINHGLSESQLKRTSMEHPSVRYAKVKQEINSISPSFCAAKWSQVTLHLHNGRTHSCHHPSTHLVPLGELTDNPSALHNTCFKKQQRKMMLEGERPPECQYCWGVEDLPNYDTSEFFSDRVVKSGATWSIDAMEQITTKPWDHNINPRYVEVSFSNICNFKCSYCSPVYSSRWTEEIETHGPYYPQSGAFNNLEFFKAKNEMPIHHKEHNPYVEAFWKWWPDLVKDLKVFRITGGEPLLAADTFKVLDFLHDNPCPDLELAINTNGCVPDSKLNECISKARRLLDGKCVDRFEFYTSVDGAGKQAEYGRFGLDYDKWIKNVDRMLTEVPGSRVTIMSTLNIFSITSYTKLLADLLDLKEKHGTIRLFLDIAILKHPHHQCLSILTDEYKGSMDECMVFMRNNTDRNGQRHFMHFETSRMQRLIDFIKAPPHKNERLHMETARRNFAIFVDEHDRRRGTDFHATFPELKRFYDACKSGGSLRMKDLV